MKKIIPRAIGFYLNALSFISPQMTAKQGFKIWCHPFRLPMKDYHKDFLNASDKFEFTFEDKKIQGYRWGNGSKKIVLIHGWQSHTFRWKKYIEAMADKDVTIYAMDAPGHGFSEGDFLHVPLYSDAIRALLDVTGPIHAVVSHSMGSFSILHALHTSPIAIEKLVLMAPPRMADDFISQLRDTLRLRSRAMKFILDYFEVVIDKPIEYFSTARFASQLSIPGLIIHDEKDKETPYEASLRIHDNWKKSQLVTTSGLGHNLKSEDVIQMVCNFVLQDEVVMVKA